MELGILLQMTVALILHMVRAGAFFAVVTFFGRQRDSVMIRLILSISIGTIMWWVGDRMLPVPPTFLELGVMALTEGVIGLALGFAISTLMSMLIIAGEVISMEMGFSMARSINPESGTNATVVSQFLFFFWLMMVF